MLAPKFLGLRLTILFYSILFQVRGRAGSTMFGSEADLAVPFTFTYDDELEKEVQSPETDNLSKPNRPASRSMSRITYASLGEQSSGHGRLMGDWDLWGLIFFHQSTSGVMGIYGQRIL